MNSVTELKQINKAANKKVRQLKNRVEDEIENELEYLQELKSQVYDTAANVRDSFLEYVEKGSKQLAKRVKKSPNTSVAIALVIGTLLGLSLSRRAS